MAYQRLVVLVFLTSMLSACTHTAVSPPAHHAASSTVPTQTSGSTPAVAPTSTRPSSLDRYGVPITMYQGTALPAPSGENGALQRFFPPAWLVVNDQRIPGMYLAFGSGEYVPDLAALPRVEVPADAQPVIVIGAGEILEVRPSTVHVPHHPNEAYQPLAFTPDAAQPSVFLLAPVTATAPQQLEVFVQFRNLETVSYGWQVLPQPAP